MKDHELVKNREIQVDDDTSSILEAIAEADDDPLLIAEAARVDPTEFRQFISECGEVEDEDAIQLLKAAESLQRAGGNWGGTGDYRRDGGNSLSPWLADPGIQGPRQSPFRLMAILSLGLGVSLAYGLLGSSLLWYLDGQSEALLFFTAYTTSFKTFISLSLILGIALIVFYTQNLIPQTIETAFTEEQLSETYYIYYKRRFASLRISITLWVECVVVGFVIFSYSQFPLSRRGEALMVIAACAEYALGVYVIRKLMYTGMMLHSLLPITVKRNLFRRRELDAINSYVNVISTLTVIFVYVYVIGYYEGPFLYSNILGQSIKPFLLLPAIIATSVLVIFNFYPRAVLRKLYGQAIDIERVRLRDALQNEELSAFEKHYYMIEFEKMSRNDLRSSLMFTLGDLIIGITILIMVYGLLRQ